MLGMIAAALMQGAPAEAAPTIVNPDWQRFPNAQDVSKYYPKPAIKDDLAGRAVIACSVTAEGRLIACRAQSETPAGAGFGDAGVRMAEDVIRMRPQTRDGQPVGGGTVSIPLVFIMPANLRASAARVRHPDVTSEIVELDCRFIDTKLDNCFPRGGSSRKVRDTAVQLAESVVLPPLPTKRRQGRIVVPMIFTDEAGASATPGLVTRANWRERPTLAEVFRAYPEAARALAPVGNVVSECTVTRDGRLEGCATVSEDPAGLRFGEAALGLMPSFRMEDVDGFGLKVAGRKVRVAIRFSPAAPPTRP